MTLYFPFLTSERMIRQGLVTTREFVVVIEQNQSQYISAVSSDILQKNRDISIGMALSNLRAAIPEVVSYQHDHQGDRAFLHNLMRWVERYTPKLAVQGTAELLLDVAGTPHLFGGIEQMAHQIYQKLHRAGITVQLAVAENSAASRAMARATKKPVFIQRKPLDQVVQHLPVHVLNLTNQEQLLTRHLGLKTIRDMITLPRKQLASRLSAQTMQHLAEILGERKSVVKFARHKKAWKESVNFPEPIANRDYIIEKTEGLLDALCMRLDEEQKGISSLAMIITRADHEDMTKCITMVRPTIDQGSIMGLLLPFFHQLDVGFGIEEILLEATQIEQVKVHQNSFLQEGISSKDQGQLINRLSNLLGADHVLKLTPADSHLPDKEMVIQPALYAYKGEKWHRPLQRRPWLLYPTPKKVAQVCDAFPASIEWEGRLEPVQFLSGPERICPQWWMDDLQWRDGMRDYYWVLCQSGALLWLYSTQNGWYAHGLC